MQALGKLDKSKITGSGRKNPKRGYKSPDGREAVEALLQDAERDPGPGPIYNGSKPQRHTPSKKIAWV